MALADDVGSKWSVGIDGRGYIVSTLDQESPFEYRAFTQQAVPLRLPRIDTSPEPGEASLGDLWVRSQHDWSEGMGQRVFDGLNSSRLKAKSIGGYDPFIIEGSLTSPPNSGNTAIDAQGPGIAIGTLIYFFDGASLHRYDEALTEETETITERYSGNPFGSPHNFAADGQNIFYSTSLGIFKMLTTDAFGSWVETEVKINNLTNCTVVFWGKGRLIACRSNDVHIINDLSELADGAVAHYSNQDPSWLWTDAEDLSQGIYLSGYSDAESKLYLMSFDTTDAAAGLTIGIPREVWRASDGERILCVQSYAGSAMVLGTSKGVRNCTVIDREGNVSVGPLIETAEDVEVWDIGVWGRYAFFFYGRTAGFSQPRGRVAKLDLTNFALAAPFPTGAAYKAAHGISIVIPPWYKEWQSPVSVVEVDGIFSTTYTRSNPVGNPVVTPLAALEVGDITFGTSVEKELKHIEVELDSRNFAWRHGGINPLSTTPVTSLTSPLTTFMARMALGSWVGDPDVLFYQGLSTTDYHWRIRLLASRALEFSWLDNTDVVRTATSAALPAGWNEGDTVWILITWFSSAVNFYYLLEKGNPLLAPAPHWDENTWTLISSPTVSPTGPFKGGVYGGYPIVLFEEIPSASIEAYLYSFGVWSFLWYQDPESRDVFFTPTRFAPDVEGNTWDLNAQEIISPQFKVQYNLDRRGWVNLTEVVNRPTGVDQVLFFPADTTARTLELILSSVRSDSDTSGHAITDWRLLAEPIPTPRYYRYFVPLMLYDDMNTLDGHRISRKGLAFEMLGDLETLYRNGTAFDFQKPSGYLERTVSTKVRIEEMEFKEFAQTKGASGFGGICLVVMKEVAT